MTGPLRTPFIATLAIIALVVAWTTIGRIGAAERMATLRPGGPQDMLAVAITLPFKPEAFHLTQAQELGQLLRVEQDTLYLINVRRDVLAAFARHYWIKHIAPWKQGR